MSEVITKYMEILLREVERDAAVATNPWVFWTVLPLLFYLILTGFKWSVLLLPITLPLGAFRSFLRGLWKVRKKTKKEDK